MLCCILIPGQVLAVFGQSQGVKGHCVCSLSFPCHSDAHMSNFLWAWEVQPAWGFGLSSGGGSPVVAGEAASCPESSEANVSRARVLQAWGRFGMRYFSQLSFLSRTGAVSCWPIQTCLPSQAHAGCTTSSWNQRLHPWYP